MSESTVCRSQRGLAGRLVAAGACALVGTASFASDADEAKLTVPEPAERCVSCHALTPDEPALEGPTLWRVVGRPVASVPGYEYSAALKALGGNWTRERLERFLTGPQSFAPGTRMELGGVRQASDRQLVLDFLETLKPAADGSSANDNHGKRVADASVGATVAAAAAP
jgi:cytochrome c